MRTYDQYCAVARALDVVGDRWTLLLVRELLIQGPCRYTDLQYGLPSIATNLLADRLRELEESGIITREAAPPPVATTLFHLTPRGQALKPVIEALGLWGSPLLQGPSGDAQFRSHWLAFPLELYLDDHDPEGPPATIEVHTGEQPMLIEIDGGAIHVRPGSVPAPNGTLIGTPSLILGLLTGVLDLATARARGLTFEGNEGTLRRVQPNAAG
jgi:DNA-binding HxlR family transcriptional regulator